MSIAEPNAGIQELIKRLDAAMEGDPGGRCHRVKDVLEELCVPGADFLEPRFLQPAPDKYARRLLHIDPEGRYSALAMVWGPGQGTPIHDHDNMWCCECVYQGRIQVDSYQIHGDLDADHVDFQLEQTIFAGPGEAGALIPPFDHHTIANSEATPSVTIHIYGGEMVHCHVFLPCESGSGFDRVERHLCYTD